MSRWIDADVLIAELKDRWNKCDLGEFAENVWSVIDDAPSIDIEPKRGEWIEQEDCWQCSVCGDEYVLEVGVKPIDAKMNFCPNCGARMKGADDEE